jgi:hypothetical protein
MVADDAASQPDQDRTPGIEPGLAREPLEDPLQLAREIRGDGNVMRTAIDAERQARPDRPHAVTRD